MYNYLINKCIDAMCDECRDAMHCDERRDAMHCVSTNYEYCNAW